MTLGESYQNYILNIDRNQIDEIQTLERFTMKLKIYNRYTDVSRMKSRVSDLFRFLTDKDKISIGRKNSESH